MKRNICIFILLGIMLIFISCGAIEEDETMGIYENEHSTDNNIENQSTSEKETFEGYYEYPTEGVSNAQELYKKCRIEQKILDSMSVEQLAQATVDYPLLMDVLAYSDMKSKAETYAKQCDAYKELITRSGAKRALKVKVAELKDSGDEDSIVRAEILQQIIDSEASFETPTRGTLGFDTLK